MFLVFFENRNGAGFRGVSVVFSPGFDNMVSARVNRTVVGSEGTMRNSW